MDVSKSMGPNGIHPKILKYLSKESFIYAISKLFEKFIEYEIISYTWKTAIEISLHKGLADLKSNYCLVSWT